MNFNTPRAARALLLSSLPLCALAALTATATAQELRSSVTSFDKDGNPIIQETSGDPTRASIATFDRNGKATVTYTSPPLVPVNGLGTTAPDPNPGIYNRFGYTNAQPFPPGYFNPNANYQGFNYGYPAPIYPPAYPVQNQPIVAGNANGLTVIPLSNGYAYPAPYAAAPYGYPAPAFGYPAPGYGYPAPGYGYPVPAYPYGYGANYGYNNGFGNGTFSTNTAGYGIAFGRGGFSASFGGSNTTTRSSTTITIR